MTRRNLLLSLAAAPLLGGLGLLAQAPQTPAQVPVPPPAPLFTEAERNQIREYWNVPGRYKVEPSPDVLDRVNITVAGSTWWWSAVKVIAERKATAPAEAASWEDWFKKRAAFEKAVLQDRTDAPDAGPIPPGLFQALGNPPALYERVRPQRYTIAFAPEDTATPFVYEDAIDFGKRAAYFAYYRFTNGIIRIGKQLKDYTPDEKKQAEAMFAQAGKSDFERRVLAAVSAYEGGFEAVNTYDTGFVSVGFIQCITAKDGDGSLTHVLLRHKADDPADFQAAFRRFGIDAAPTGIIVVVDPTTGEEKRGADAVQAIINDKRLIAVFERAGVQEGFRLAQIRVARDRYWPGNEPVNVSLNVLCEQAGGQAEPKILAACCGVVEDLPVAKAALAAAPERQKTDAAYRVWVEARPVTCKVSDIVRSEAGMATLMDRKVNRGNIRNIHEVAARLMRDNNLTRVEDLAKFEKALIAEMKYRGDFLADTALSQPQ